MNNALTYVELAKTHIEHTKKKQNDVKFLAFKTQNFESWISTLNFPSNFGDLTKIAAGGGHKFFTYWSCGEGIFEYNRPETKTELDWLRSMDCNVKFTADLIGTFPWNQCGKQKEIWQATAWSFQRSVQKRRVLCLCYTNFCCYDFITNRF